MRVPTLPHLVLLFFLGVVFVHFMMAGGRTLYTEKPEEEPGALIGQLSFMVGGTLPVWLLGLYHPIQLLNGVIASCVLLSSIVLYEWARHTIWSRRFGIGWGERVPDELCEAGPYRFVRHPLYLSYMLAFLAAYIALPAWLTAAMLIVNTALFVHGARHDERRIAESPLAAAYADYRKRVGMFFPVWRSKGSAAAF